ncbi:hypothetical protein [Zavarzinella formosa]|uniref:hypothetical protein n=1 Tax=Zavarzinella formosa TaxID=360055 RepID=UPI00030E44A9|nr:hypothetical protein [Zavarzinella formosa]
MKTVIKRCPVCPTIRSHTDLVVSFLERDLDVEADVEDGESGEFSVFVDGTRVIQREGDSLPDVEEVEAAVENAIPIFNS